VETANANTQDSVERRQPVRLRLHIGSYVYEADFTIYDVKGFDIVLGRRWMRDINGRHHIDHHTNEMWVAAGLPIDGLARGENGALQCGPGPGVLRACRIGSGRPSLCLDT
jgi:hypothetical protein